MKPEIDEAAAVERFRWHAERPDFGGDDQNAARAALAWKARAESKTCIHDIDDATVTLAAELMEWKARADAAEAEVARMADFCPECGHTMTVDEVGEFDDGSMRCEVCALKAERDSLRRQLAQAR